MSAFMVHPWGCISRGEDPLKKVLAQQGVGLQADGPSKAQWGMPGRNGGKYPRPQWGNMGSAWNLDEEGYSDWLEVGGCLGQSREGVWTSEAQVVLNLNKSCFLPASVWGIGMNSRAHVYNTVHVGIREEELEEKPCILRLVLLYVVWLLTTHNICLDFFICRMKGDTLF
jgi:hypothetical protein